VVDEVDLAVRAVYRCPVAAAKKSKKRKKTASPQPPAPQPPAATPRTWKRYAVIALAGLYLADVWLDGVGSNAPSKILPRSVLYFGQIAALFPHAGEKQIDYRAEGWVCTERKWVEIDPRPWFPIDFDNKENRFYRAVQFYRENRKVMRALDEYVTTHHNAAHEASKKIGGVRILSLRIPLPPPGTKINPYKREELVKYPEDQRHNWYWTPGSMRRERCGDKAGPPASTAPKDDEDER
jgi:hypothetical protein